MINSLKTIGIFGCQFTSRYRMDMPRQFNDVAQELGVNLVYINFLGKIGDKNAEYGEYELDLIEYIDLDQFDGIIFDGEGYNVQGMSDAVIDKLRMAKCPVVSISTHVDGFYNVVFEDANGMRAVIEHFLDVHKITKIGYMSGYLTHPDAQLRLKVFRDIMKERGLPENGSGVFEGDFWFYKGKEAADYFLSLPERPEAIVCANDYMAIALITELKKRGIRVPDDIAVSGYDGTTEGSEMIPRLTTITRERKDIAQKSLSLILDILDGHKFNDKVHITPSLICCHSCGCQKIDFANEAENINYMRNIHTELLNNIYDAESSILKLNKVNNVQMLESVFDEQAVNVGDYCTFMLMLHNDRNGRLSCDSDFTTPSGKFTPIIWLDKNNNYGPPPYDLNCSELIPRTSNEPHFYYIMSAHCADRMFGYALIEMNNHDIFNEFFNMWLLNISVTLETLLKNDRISKLIGTLEDLSIRDGLTGMLNRRGFDELAREAIRSLDEQRTVCTMVIDMDGLKHINDVYGHHEGDRAIKSAANIITKCCDAGEIAGRAGGDEFYIFAPEYSQKKLNRFIERLNEQTKILNDRSNKPYKVELSYGTYLAETDNNGLLDSFINISDSRMYEMKMSKPNRRK